MVGMKAECVFHDRNLSPQPILAEPRAASRHPRRRQTHESRGHGTGGSGIADPHLAESQEMSPVPPGPFAFLPPRGERPIEFAFAHGTGLPHVPSPMANLRRDKPTLAPRPILVDPHIDH